jgi:hypothetical protein
VATRLADLRDLPSPLPISQATPTAQTHDHPRQASTSTSTPGYWAQWFSTLQERLLEPTPILLSELLTNLSGLSSTLIGGGPVSDAASRAVGPLGLFNAGQLFLSNWPGPTRIGVGASVTSYNSALMSIWAAWYSEVAVDFHSRFGAINAIASEMADVRDALNDRSDNPARSAALLVRILSIWAASISTFLSIYEAENEGDAAPTYGMAASVLPVAGTVAGAVAEALNRESVRNRLGALLAQIRSLIERLLRALGYGELPASRADPSPV